jgi:uncharacterized integral membrane protein
VFLGGLALIAGFAFLSWILVDVIYTDWRFSSRATPVVGTVVWEHGEWHFRGPHNIWRESRAGVRYRLDGKEYAATVSDWCSAGEQVQLLVSPDHPGTPFSPDWKSWDWPNKNSESVRVKTSAWGFVCPGIFAFLFAAVAVGLFIFGVGHLRELRRGLQLEHKPEHAVRSPCIRREFPTTRIGGYLVTEDPDRLVIGEPSWHHIARLCVFSVVGLGGLCWLAYKIIGNQDLPFGWFIFGALLTLLVFLGRVSLVRGRIKWVLDRTRDSLDYRGKPVGSLKDITHLSRWVLRIPHRDHMGRPRSGETVLYILALGPRLGCGLIACLNPRFQIDRFAFAKESDCDELATRVSEFLGVSVHHSGSEVW